MALTPLAILICAVVSMFFPEIIYAPFALILIGISSFSGLNLGHVAMSISYFGALPFVGVMFFIFLPKSVKLRVNFIFIGNSLVEYLGLILLFVWYLANMFEIYSNGMNANNEVVVPSLRSPVTSIGLWFSGILLGVVISLGMHKSINYLWGGK
jgi:hypothetical protein